MFICRECLHTFITPCIISERHGLTEPPFEEFACCPLCKGQSLERRMKNNAK